MRVFIVSLIVLAGLLYEVGGVGAAAPIEDCDFDGDQQVSILDLNAQAVWFTQQHSYYDVDGDGMVSVLDLSSCAAHFGKSFQLAFSETPIVTSGLGTVTAFDIALDGRVFVAEKSGAVRVIKNGSLLATPFLTVTTTLLSERGLIGITLDPGFDSNGYVYVHYTATDPNIHGRVSRFVAQGDVSTGVETILLELDAASSTGNHNGGQLVFGLDGKLYIHTGDAQNGANSTSLTSTHGKILRINSDATIPTDNPFYASTTGRYQSIYAMGLRNPFTGAVDSLTGKHYINDVGEVTYEEINELVAGADYGWPTCEGSCGTAGKTNPVFQYGRTVGRAITGGVFYRGDVYPKAWGGRYIFGDFTADRIWQLKSGSQLTMFSPDAPVDVTVDSAGNVYWLGLFGRVSRLNVTVNTCPC